MAILAIRNQRQIEEMKRDGFTQEYVTARFSKLGVSCEIANYRPNERNGVFGVWIDGAYRDLQIPKLKKPFSV